MQGDANWAEVLQAVGSIATPLVVIVFATFLGRRQDRNSELLKARVEYYKQLVPDANDLMCYLTFIGTWRDVSPIEIIAIKRRLDRNFFCAAPLFSDTVRASYTDFMSLGFATFQDWGTDARINTSAYRRRQAWQSDRFGPWDPTWDARFTVRDADGLDGKALDEIRKAHDDFISALVNDLQVTRTRDRYTTELVAANAHAPMSRSIPGAP